LSSVQLFWVDFAPLFNVNAEVLDENDWVMELETSLLGQKRRMMVAVLAVKQRSYGLAK